MDEAENRCHMCDRPKAECPRWDPNLDGGGRVYMAAVKDCNAHTVDWRSRCATLSAELAEAVGLLRERAGNDECPKLGIPCGKCWLCRLAGFLARVSR